MSCTFWLRRKKYVAKQHEQERIKAEQQAEAERQAAEKAAEAAKRAAERKAAKKAVAENDNEGTV